MQVTLIDNDITDPADMDKERHILVGGEDLHIPRIGELVTVQAAIGCDNSRPNDFRVVDVKNTYGFNGRWWVAHVCVIMGRIK